MMEENKTLDRLLFAILRKATMTKRSPSSTAAASLSPSSAAAAAF